MGARHDEFLREIFVNHTSVPEKGVSTEVLTPFKQSSWPVYDLWRSCVLQHFHHLGKVFQTSGSCTVGIFNRVLV